MALTNVSKPSTSLTNTTKVSFAELWSTITTTWASETRTWADCASLIDNLAKTTISPYLWSMISYPWLEDTPWDNVFDGITNIAKP
jgi:hypothetical protein